MWQPFSEHKYAYFRMAYFTCVHVLSGWFIVHHLSVFPLTYIQVWPYLLGVYPAESTQEERADILKKSTEQYEQVLAAWQGVELTKREIEKEVVLVNGHRSGSVGDLVSPSLSTISGSLPSSPDRSRTGTPDRSHDNSGDPACHQQSDEDSGGPTPVVENGVTHNNLEVIRNGLEESDEDGAVNSQRKRHFDSKHLDDCSLNQSHDQSHEQASDQDCDRDHSPAHLLFPHDPEELVMSSLKLDSRAKVFVKELYNIDKDIPRCDRDYW